MTDLAKRLHAAIDNVDTDAVVTVLAPLSEPERAALNPGVAARALDLHGRFLAHHSGPSPESILVHQQLTPAFLAWNTSRPNTSPPPAPSLRLKISPRSSPPSQFEASPSATASW